MSPTFGELWRLAWPASLTLTIRSLYRLNDQYFVADLGVEAQAAVAVGSMVAIALFAFGELVGVGNLAVAGRRLGEGDDVRAAATVRTSIRLGLAIGAGLALATVWGRGPLSATLIPDSPAEAALLTDYLLWIGAGQILLVTMPAIESSFIAHRRARTPLLLELLAVASNAALNAALVPRLGVEGAGLATALSRVAPLLIGLWLLGRAGVERPLAGAGSRAIARRLLAVGVPTCIAILLYSAVYQVMLAWTFPRFGAAGRSALGPGFGIESVFYCGYWGIAYANGALVARCLGAGDPGGAARIARIAMAVNLGAGLLSAVVFWALGPALIGLLATDPTAIAANVDYLWFMAWAQPLQSCGLVCEQVLAGAGMTAPLVWSTGVGNLARIPLAHLLGVVANGGLQGIWLAINASTLGKAAWAFLLFRRGRWRDHRV